MTAHELSLRDLDEFPVVRVPVSSLMTGLSPRAAGEDPSHIRTLAQLGIRLPPILVRQETMQVIDGAHRLAAARLRGDAEIEARIIDVGEAASYVLAVQANVTHGLPLSLSDRRGAAKRVLELHPRWSSRKVAEVAGLSPATVARLRERLTGQDEQLDSVGKDGRTRPKDAARRRSIARQLMIDEPGISLRDVAKRAGISAETARNVRARLAEGDLSEAKLSSDTFRSAAEELPGLGFLVSDPFFQSTDNGRLIMRALSTYMEISEGGVRIARSIPGHCGKWLADAARAYGQAWQEFADCIDLVKGERRQDNSK